MALTGLVLCFRATVFEIQNKDRSFAVAMNITKVYLILCTACVIRLCQGFHYEPTTGG